MAVIALVWFVARLCEGSVRVPDFVMAGLVRVADGAPARAAPVRRLEATVDLGETPKAVVDERYLSIAIDSSLIVGGHWWSPGGEVEPIGRQRVAPLDLTNPILRARAREFGPAYLRIGGTEADTLYYELNQDNSAVAPRPYDFVLTRNQWDGLIDFARDANLDLFFTLNAGPSSRDAQRRWKSENAERLLHYAQSRKQRIAVLEFGNEINGYWFTYGFSQQPDGVTIANDLGTLRALVRRYTPQTLIVGPGEFYWPRIGSPLASYTNVLSGLLETDRGHNLDALTWHYYPQQSRRCPMATHRASVTGLLDPSSLDEASRWASTIEDLRDRHAPGLPVWLSETGGAQCGGEPGVSDRFVSSLWWVDELGLLAAHGQSVVVRQTLLGSNYGLLDEKTLEPRPDYFASILYKRLMGRVVLDVSRDTGADPFLRIYGHCTPENLGKKPGSVTLLAINLHQHETAAVNWTRATGRSVDYYRVTAPSLESSMALLNGLPMTLPRTQGRCEPQPGRFEGTYTLAPSSYAFLVIDAEAAACLSKRE